ncbi:N-benzyl-3-pyrrolidinol dehydrogenase [Phaeosphaeriaceae sp. PMI808]|nr:N-benzyl-3-pyrrolidinol dehydrogenase [Phaeosphaeriaceae sp. PMI808]
MSSYKHENVPNTMWAWRKHRGNIEPVWEEIPTPRPHATGLLIKLIAAGVCRSDHNLLTNENQPPWFQEKFTLGHEGCGHIVQIGSSVPSKSGFAIGDVVALLAVPGCGSLECEECINNLPQLCLKGYRSGIGMDGYFASYCVIDIRGAAHVPKGVTPSQAAVATDAVATAYHAVHRRGEIKSTDVVFLFGLGGLGFNALQIIRSIGATVLLSDVKQENIDAAIRYGVSTERCVPKGKGVREWVQENGWGGKISIVADFVGTAQTFSDAQNIVRQAGRMLCVGTLNHENAVYMKIAIRKRLTISFSYGGQITDLIESLKLIAEGVLNPIVVEGKLEDFPQVIKNLEAGQVQGRVALLFD